MTIGISIQGATRTATRPFCVHVSWLAKNRYHATHMEYRDGSTGEWKPATEAIDTIDHGWPVEVRLTEATP